MHIHIYVCIHDKNNVPPGYHYNGFVTTHTIGHINAHNRTSCAQLHELPQIRDNSFDHCFDHVYVIYIYIYIYIYR